MKSHATEVKTFSQLLRRLTSSVDSIPLVGALTTAAIICSGYITYQFAVRPDFKVLRTSGNRVDGIDKPLPISGNHVFWVLEPHDNTPPEVKSTMKELRAISK
ncbi:hypothetical protein BOX15_Mlig025306g1 [Macrostomum lignano]|uniref:Uncharacterized protein n=1 Tax=Macrostomum lignano TaxID=282301 RepID=A0A267ETL4_9PLAT|nr:hypothetical protein BOX15_Mlig025306g1 [Macrostomum lignano]